MNVADTEKDISIIQMKAPGMLGKHKFVWKGKGKYPLPFCLASLKICARETFLVMFKF